MPFQCVDNDGAVYPVEIVNNETDCDTSKYPDRHWVNAEMNFDHVGYAYLSLFQVATFKGWTIIMADATDARAVGGRERTAASRRPDSHPDQNTRRVLLDDTPN